jgi:uncharacterized protein YcbX
MSGEGVRLRRVRVERIGFTPVKGGRHVAHDHVDLASTGPVGDRVFCLVDPARRRVLRTVENPGLVQQVWHWRGGELRVDLPSGPVAAVPEGTGSVIEVDYWGRVASLEVVEGPWAAACSRLLGYDVVLARSAPGEVVYGAPVSLVTTESLRWLGKRVGHEVEAERFRATLLVDSGPDAGRAEDAWVGRRLGVGDAQVEVVGTIPRCAVIDLDPVTGLRDRSLLKALDGPDLTFGVDAVVTRPGRVRLRDPVSIA